MGEVLRNFEFREVPVEFSSVVNKSIIYKRKVFIEKTVLDTTESALYASYMASFMEKKIKETSSQFIMFEKNIIALRRIEKKFLLKKSRKKMYEVLSKYVKQIKSNPEEITADITSLENIEFNRPCSDDEFKELKKQFDYYVYQDSVDEIEGIKHKDIDGIDAQRLNYCNSDEISEKITQRFVQSYVSENKRLPENYEQDCFIKAVDRLLGTSKTRTVLLEKIDNPTNTSYSRFINTTLRIQKNQKKQIEDVIRVHHRLLENVLHTRNI